ncbi:MAG TPA: amidohydrolase family protein [Solirubrobacteraceae bacterium]|nr:amidohydrolase family protein [Solirubrobacteraceae bacterium]
MGSAAVVVTGDIITMDPARPRVEAVAVVGGRVAAAGSRDDAVAACPAGTSELALPGTVVPGMIDSHVHMLWGGRALERLDLAGVATIADVLERIAAAADALPAGAWVLGTASIDREDVAEGRFPTLAELDAATGGRPLFLDRRAHDGFANSAAFAAAGIDAGTPDPPGGVIERDADGRPTGFLVERPAAELVERAAPPDTLTDRLRWLAAIQPEFLRRGITSVVDPALTPDEMLAYEAAADRGALTVRTTAMPLGDGEVEPAEMLGRFTAAGVDLARRDDVLRVGPIKLFLDGGGSLGTAMLREPWPGSDGYRGNQTTSTEGLFAYCRWAAAQGRGVGVHCVGGAAIDLALEAFAAADAERPIAGLGFTLIHAYLWPTAENMARARELGVLVATQPQLQYAFGPGLVRRFGEEAVGRAHPMRSWVESGAIVGAGSDGPDLATVAPLFALWQMQRRTIEGRDDAIGAHEAVDAEQALALYTTGAAAVTLAGDRGRLAAGCIGDLVALDVDPLTASPEDCRDGAVLATVVGGEQVF